MNSTTVFVIRKMLRNFLNPQTAKAANISVEQMESFRRGGNYQPTEAQLVALAQRMKLQGYAHDRRR
ncbi:hypothetical protein JQ543_13655 [Bradyrhizobium diazoefficiens]|nr:hypothetical protein [Bradyrhizobium diazoefficiens]MBR0848793.1 hypothetical protein [Bradyrhizobium diazoefficiens]